MKTLKRLSKIHKLCDLFSIGFFPDYWRQSLFRPSCFEEEKHNCRSNFSHWFPTSIASSLACVHAATKINIPSWTSPALAILGFKSAQDHSILLDDIVLIILDWATFAVRFFRNLQFGTSPRMRYRTWLTAAPSSSGYAGASAMVKPCGPRNESERKSAT